MPIQRLCVRLLALIIGASLGTFSPLAAEKEDWRLISVSSENPLTGELARNAFDGDPETQWHSLWHPGRDAESATPPHSIAIDLIEPLFITTLRIRTRAHGEGGFPQDYRFEVSHNGRDWKTAVEGTFTYRSRFSPHAQVDLNTTHSTRFIRLTISSLTPSSRQREPGLVISEIDLGTPSHPLPPTTLIAVPQSREWNYGGYDWKIRHRALIDHAMSHPAQLVFIGDSITHRWGAPPHDETPPTGQEIWNQYYQDRQALNLGYGWDRIENMIWRVQHGELDHSDPKLVVVMAGTNNLEVNTPEDIAQGVRQLCLEIHQRKPDAQILLLAVFPRGSNAYPENLLQLNRRLESFGKESFIHFQDIGSVFLNAEGLLTRDIMPDLLHPGVEGYRRWAKAIEANVVRFMSQTQK